MQEIHETIVHDIGRVAAAQNVELLLIGAVARDELFVNGEYPQVGRMTLDVDFACHLKTWGDYDRFLTSLELLRHYRG